MKRALLLCLPLLAAACRSAEPSPYCPPPAPPPLDAAFAASNGLDAATAYFTDYDRDSLPAYVEQALGLSATNAYIPAGVSDWHGASSVVSPEWRWSNGLAWDRDGAGSEDSDDDGWDDWSEMCAGTAPEDPASLPRPSVRATVRSAHDLSGRTLRAWAWRGDAVGAPPAAVLSGPLEWSGGAEWTAELAVEAGRLLQGRHHLWIWAGGDSYAPDADPAAAPDLSLPWRLGTFVGWDGADVTATLSLPSDGNQNGIAAWRRSIPASDTPVGVEVATVGGVVLWAGSVARRGWLCDLDFATKPAPDTNLNDWYFPGANRIIPGDIYPNELNLYVGGEVLGVLTNRYAVSAPPPPEVLGVRRSGAGWRPVVRVPAGWMDMYATVDGAPYPPDGGRYPAPGGGVAEAVVEIPAVLGPGAHTVSVELRRQSVVGREKAAATNTLAVSSLRAAPVRVRVDGPPGATATLEAYAAPTMPGRPLVSATAPAGSVASLGPLPVHTPWYVRATAPGCTAIVSRAASGGRTPPLACFADWSTNRVVILPR